VPFLGLASCVLLAAQPAIGRRMIGKRTGRSARLGFGGFPLGAVSVYELALLHRHEDAQ
jgi:hypothetical protein